jgi:hypothetical protein
MRLGVVLLLAAGCATAQKDLVRYDTASLAVSEAESVVEWAVPEPKELPAIATTSARPVSQPSAVSAPTLAGVSVVEVVVETPSGRYTVKCPKEEPACVPPEACRPPPPPPPPEPPLWQKILEEALKPIGGAVGALVVSKFLTTRRRRKT